MPDQRPKIGLLLPTRGVLLREERPPNVDIILRQAQRAEELGFDSVWVGDSLTSKPRLDPLTTLAAVAMRTEKVELGTSVLLGALYQPVVLARSAATVDLLSKGRLTLALGVGGAFTPEQKRDWAHASVSRTTRAARLEEVIEVMQLLWSNEVVNFQGRFFSLEETTLEPRPFRPHGIPIWLACHHRTGNDVQEQRVIRFADGFIAITDQPQEYLDLTERLRQKSEEKGRDFESMARAFYMTVNLNNNPDAAREESDRFIRAYYGVNFWEESWGPFGRPDTVTKKIQEYFDSGAQHLIVRFASYNQEQQLETFGREVLPYIR